MKIAYLTARFPLGAGEQFFEPEVKTLAELGQDVLIVPARPDQGAQLQTVLAHPTLVLKPWSVATLLAAVVETVKRPRAVLAAFRAIAAPRYRVRSKLKNVLLFPKAVAVAAELRKQRIEHIHAQWLSTPSTMAYVASLLTGIPWSCTAHRFDLFEDNLIAQKARSARFVRAISERSKSIVASRVGAAGDRHCHVVHLGVEVPQRVRGPSGNGVLEIVCAANLCGVKGHRYLLAALVLLRDRGVFFECDIVGDGPLRTSLAAQIAQSGLRGFVRMRGRVPHDRLCAELSGGKYDVCVLASIEERHEFEGIPVALIEAMAAAIPCVSTKTGSIPELIEDGSSSFLVPQRDAVALADAIQQFAADKTLRAEMGLRARARVLERFDTKRTTRELLNLIAATASAR